MKENREILKKKNHPQIQWTDFWQNLKAIQGEKIVFLTNAAERIACPYEINKQTSTYTPHFTQKFTQSRSEILL